MITPIAFNQRKKKALLVQVKLIETARIGRVDPITTNFSMLSITHSLDRLLLSGEEGLYQPTAAHLAM